jgi:hypothetical protein
MSKEIIFKLLNDIQKEEPGEKRKILEEQLEKIMSGVKQVRLPTGIMCN